MNAAAVMAAPSEKEKNEEVTGADLIDVPPQWLSHPVSVLQSGGSHGTGRSERADIVGTTWTRSPPDTSALPLRSSA